MLTRANLIRGNRKKTLGASSSLDIGEQEVIAVLAAQMRSDITELLGKDASFDLGKIRSAAIGRLIKRLVPKRVPTKRTTTTTNPPAFTYVLRVEPYSA